MTRLPLVAHGVCTSDADGAMCGGMRVRAMGNVGKRDAHGALRAGGASALK